MGAHEGTRFTNAGRDGKITQAQYNSKTAVYENQVMIDGAPLPTPDNKLNKGSK
jgi:hypothetical protein